MTNYHFDDTTLLPYTLQDASNIAMEKVIKESLNIDLTKFMTCLIDNLAEEILPILGESMHILGYEGWNDCKNSTEKRELIKNSIRLHKTKGTVFVIKKILELSGIKATYYHWKDYGGIPHHYKIVLDLEDQGISEAVQENIIRKIQEFKQLRAKLDKIELYALATKQIYIKTAVVTAETVTIDFTEQED